MSVTVRHLNADSTFLLTFSPKEEPTPAELRSANGAFTVLIDPWLVGSSVVNAKWFAITHRVAPSAFEHLSEIEEPDVVLVSQNKPDHCHKQTLLQLRPEGKTLIAAEPGAAKAIKSWNHFDPHRVHALAKYDAKAHFGNTLRLRIAPLGPEGVAGEINIAFIPAKNYVTGLHNAFGITYQPPTRVRVLAPVTTIDLPSKNFSMPFSPMSLPPQSPQHMFSPMLGRPVSSHDHTKPDLSSTRPTTAPGRPKVLRKHRPQLSRNSNTQSSECLALYDHQSVHPSKEDLKRAKTTTVPSLTAADSNFPEINFDADALIDTTHFAVTLPNPPLSPTISSSTHSPRSSNASEDSPIPPPASTNTSFSLSPPASAALPNSPSLYDLQSRYSKPPTIRPARPKVLSILYSPHGIPASDLQPYIQSHLVPLPGALPLTCLFHGFDYASNPWWFGGNIMMGADGGLEIARQLMARHWISAHDEVKDDKGVAVKLLKCDRNSAEVVRRKIEESNGAWDCHVKSLDVGETLKLSSAIDTRRKARAQSSGNDLGCKYQGVGLGVGVERNHFRLHDGG